MSVIPTHVDMAPVLMMLISTPALVMTVTLEPIVKQVCHTMTCFTSLYPIA